MEIFLDPNAWIALLTLTFLEIVLGIDNIIFISIVTGKLPEEKRKKATQIGLFLAMFMRIALLFGVTLLIAMKEPFFSVDWGFFTKTGSKSLPATNRLSCCLLPFVCVTIISA